MRNWRRGFIRLCAVVPCASLTRNAVVTLKALKLQAAVAAAFTYFVLVFVQQCVCVRVCVRLYLCARVCECSCLKRNESESFVARVSSAEAPLASSVSCDRTHAVVAVAAAVAVAVAVAKVVPYTPVLCLELIKGL